ncbi:hypothetical protein ACOMHN_028118 [Nucella lapillus]
MQQSPKYVCGRVLLPLLTLIFSSFVLVDGIQYRRLKGIDLQGPCLFVSENVKSPVTCAMLCARQVGACKAASYHTVRKTCCVGSGDNVWYDGGWALAFRAKAGLDQSFYDVWTKSGHRDDAPVNPGGHLPWGCLTMNSSRPCSAHFRSVILDNWASLGVKKVSLRLFTNGAKVLELVFNGTGSSVTSWMSPSRILQSPWNDLSTSSSAYNFFSIAPQIPYKRFFFINKFYKGCDGDTGWLCASDTMGTRVPCPWEGSSFPSFVYSTASGATLWQGTKVKNADVFAIFVQF